MIQKSYDDSPSLYLIPTPIGNFDDITIRSLNVLKSVDEILCEDTRDTGMLLSHYEIHKKLVSCHEFNESKMIDYVLSKLKAGMNLGLVTDQGTPIISDPGYIVSRGVIEAGFNVISLPGATAFVPALTSSGVEPSPFLFYGFLNAKSSKQVPELNMLKDYPFTLVFYRGTISEIIPLVSCMKGEFVIVVEGNHSVVDYSQLDIVEHVKMYLDDMSEMDAIKKVAKERGVAKSIIYQEYHNRK